MHSNYIEWIRGLIRRGEIHKFYTSKAWHKTRIKKLKEQNYECQRCKAKGIYVQAAMVHHKQHLRSRPDLAFELSNLECLCSECHYQVHHKFSYLNDEKW